MERFFEELKNRRFMVPRCEECGKHIFPPRVLVSGRGTLYAYTTNKDGLHFREQTVGIVELEEGFRILSLIGRPLEELRIGQQVYAHSLTAAGQRVAYNPVGFSFRWYSLLPTLF